jgi:hypothetical protein
MRPIFVNSVPKAGTHLLKRCLELLPGVSDAFLHVDISQPLEQMQARLARLLPGEVASGHLVHRPEYVALLRELRPAHLLMLRDPRDVALSLAEYIPRLESHYLHAHFQGLTADERLTACIAGLAEPRPAWDDVALRDVGAASRQFTPWLDEPGVWPVRFEDLVGPQGGGARDAQRRAVCELAAELELPLDEPQLEVVLGGIFHPESPTFREGAVAGWRARYSPEHVRAFKDVAGDLLVELGYESSSDW